MNEKKLETLIEILPVIIAALALILSQFPPIHEIFSDPKVKINTTYDLKISNELGNIAFQKKYSITNFGDKGDHIRIIDLYLISEHIDKIVKKFTARDRVFRDNNPMNPQGIVKEEFNAFTLSPFYTYEIPLLFYEDLMGKQLLEHQKLQTKYQLEHKNYMDNTFSMDPEEAPDFKPSEQLQTEMLAFFIKRMEWFKKGKYYIAIETIGQETNIMEYFSLIIDVADISLLKNNLESYRLGIDVAYLIQPAKIRLISLSDKAKLTKINNIIDSNT